MEVEKNSKEMPKCTQKKGRKKEEIHLPVLLQGRITVKQGC